MTEHCDECGFDYDNLPRADLGSALQDLTAQHVARLTTTPVDDLRRHNSDAWSPLEYACHLRDVLAVQRQRIRLAQREDEPVFVPMGRDERVTADRYNEQAPRVVADQLSHNVKQLTDTLDGLDDAGWARTGIYSYPTRRPRTMEWVVRNTLHELTHHLLDVDRGLNPS